MGWQTSLGLLAPPPASHRPIVHGCPFSLPESAPRLHIAFSLGHINFFWIHFSFPTTSSTHSFQSCSIMFICGFLATKISFLSLAIGAISDNVSLIKTPTSEQGLQCWETWATFEGSLGHAPDIQGSVKIKFGENSSSETN